MELVHGVPITKYCDDHRLTARQRLELFVPVCQAIQHAHQKGVIHRDIKPSNVLVALYDDKPVPKVIDFGVAKATGQNLTEKSLATGLGAIVGTLEYMSPEQAEINQLDIDTRSDIYSLGVLLYELLAGSPPFSRKELGKVGLLEMLRVIRENEPPAPSMKLSSAEGLPTLAANRGTEPGKLTRLMRGDLDWIVMKCLEKDRERRYETANGLAQDIARYLRDEVVLATPPSTAYRLRKYARRHKAALAVMVTLFLTAVGLAVGTVLIYQEQQRTANALAAETEQRGRAEAAETHAQEQATTASAVVRYLIQDLLLQASVDLQSEGRDPDVKVRTLLDRAARNIEGKFPEMPAVEAVIQAAIGDTYQSLGLLRQARGHLERAVKMYTARLGAAHPSTLQIRLSLAILYGEQGEPAAAEVRLRDLLQASLRQLGAADLTTLRIRAGLGRMCYELGKHAEAEAILNEALQATSAAPDVDRGPALGMKRTLALVSIYQGKLERAEHLFQEVVAGYTARLGADHRQTLISKTGLGWVYNDQGKSEDARQLLQDTLKVLTATLGADHYDTLNCKHNLATAFMNLGKYTEARPLFQEIIAARLAHQGPHHRDTLAGKTNLARVNEKLGEYAEAETLLREVVQVSTAALGSNHPDTLNSLRLLAVLLARDPAKRAEALAVFQAERTQLEKLAAEFPTLPRYPQQLAGNYQQTAKLLLNDPGQRDEALAAFRAELALRRKLLADSTDVVAWSALAKSHAELGILLRSWGKWPEALEASQAALTLYEKLAAENPPEPLLGRALAGCYCNLGSVLSDSGKSAESLDWFARALGRLDSQQDATARLFRRNTHWGRASALDRLHRHAEGLPDWDQAVELSEPKQRPALRASRAEARLRAGQVDGAVAEVAELTKLKWNHAGLYNFACIYAVASAKDQARQDEYARRAMDLLRQAVQAGYQDVAHLQQDTDLDPLRPRDDFQELLTKLNQNR
jgi:non-specific serine/threonine protein kinase/serine/threonine-protein kinase